MSVDGEDSRIRRESAAVKHFFSISHVFILSRAIAFFLSIFGDRLGLGSILLQNQQFRKSTSINFCK